MMWKTLKTLVKPKQERFAEKSIVFEKDNNLIIAQTDQHIANEFNSYFISSVQDIVNSIDAVNMWTCTSFNVINSAFDMFRLLTMNELRKILMSLDNKNSVNFILNTKILKYIFEIIGHVLLHFVNISMSEDEFPSELKCSSVIPIPKVANSNNACDYCPINTLPPIEKVLEIAVYEQLLEYFNKNDLLLGNQSGFRIHHSCETALQLTIANWNDQMDNDYYIVAVFIDFKRAFETIDRKILLRKLKYYGVGGMV